MAAQRGRGGGCRRDGIEEEGSGVAEKWTGRPHRASGDAAGARMAARASWGSRSTRAGDGDRNRLRLGLQRVTPAAVAAALLLLLLPPPSSSHLAAGHLWTLSWPALKLGLQRPVRRREVAPRLEECRLLLRSAWRRCRVEEQDGDAASMRRDGGVPVDSSVPACRAASKWSSAASRT